MVLNINAPKGRDKLLQKYYTDHGNKALHRRLREIVNLYLDDVKYPSKTKMLGFPSVLIHSKQHHEGMISNLGQILGMLTVTMQREPTTSEMVASEAMK